MNKWVTRAALAIVCVGLGFLAWRIFFPNHEQLIRKRLTELAAACSFPPNELPLTSLKNCQKAVSFCAPDVEIIVNVPNYPMEKISGREDLLQKALASRAFTGGLKVEFFDVVVKVEPDKKSAVATLTGKARLASEKDFFLQELKFTFKRIDRDWLVSRVETVRTL